MRTGLRELYFRRLLRHALAYRSLFAIVVIAGILNVALTFVFPWLIGTAIDRVTAPDWLRWGATSTQTFEQRIHWLWLLIGIGAGTALMSGVVTYLRGHFTVKLGNRVIVSAAIAQHVCKSDARFGQ